MTAEEIWIREKLGQTDFDPKYEADWSYLDRPKHLRFDMSGCIDTTNEGEILPIFKDYLSISDNSMYIVIFYKGSGQLLKVSSCDSEIIGDLGGYGTVDIIKSLMSEFGKYPQDEIERIKRSEKINTICTTTT